MKNTAVDDDPGADASLHSDSHQVLQGAVVPGCKPLLPESHEIRVILEAKKETKAPLKDLACFHLGPVEVFRRDHSPGGWIHVSDQ